MWLQRLFLAAFVVLGLGSVETVAQTMARDELRELSAEGARQRDAGNAEEALSTAEVIAAKPAFRPATQIADLRATRSCSKRADW
jgi:hypothetical protein